MYVLAKFAERYDANSYGQLIRRALGRKTAAGLSAVLLVYLWGSCVAYLVRAVPDPAEGAEGCSEQRYVPATGHAVVACCV
jgi:hypothetical protein